MLKGKTALVTGSTSGIGLGIAEALAAQGANVVLNGFGDKAEIERLRARLSATHGVSVAYDNADMSRADAIERMMKTALAAHGAVDILVNNAGIYSNTPVEVVLDDKPRKDTLIFAANVWHATGPEPETILQVLGRQKDIQYASRATSHVSRQQQIHRMRHIIRELARHIPEASRKDPEVTRMLDYGCATVMHLVPLHAPRLEGEDHTKDIDFTAAGIDTRRKAGYADTRRVLERQPWAHCADTRDGIIIHGATQ